MFEIFGFFGWLLIIILTSVVASNKGRSVIGWLFLSLFFGPLALIAILCLPNNSQELEAMAINSGSHRKCPFCAELVMSAAIVCKHCGRDLPILKTVSPEEPKNKNYVDERQIQD